MTALAGVLRLDGAPVEAAELERVFAPVRHRGPDHVGRHLDAGGFGLVVGVMATTPEDVGRAQPVVAAGACLGFDGRLDNRDELRARLGPPPGDGESDAELALRAFGAWGDAFLGELVGDFALALWESAPRRLVLARDVLGRRSLLYHLGARHLVFGTEVAQVLAHPAVPARPDLETVAGYLTGALPDARATLYEGVRRVGAGEHLELFAGRARARRAWRFDGARRLGLRGDDAHAAHLRAALLDVVGASARVVGPLASHLSGGVDSSAITALAAEVTGRRVTAASLVFPGEACDETPYIEAVVAHTGVPSIRVAPLALEPEDPRDQARRYRDLPDYPNTAMHAPLLRALRERGARVVLTGEGGDELWAGGFTHAADLLVAGHPVAAVRRALADRHVESFSWPRWGVVRHVLGPLVPGAVRRLRPRRRDALLGPALEPFAARRTRDLDLPVRDATHAQREALDELLGPWAMQGNESGDRFLARAGLEARAPLVDRRMVALALAFPEEQKRAGGVPKAVLRRALGQRLPAQVRDRLTKATFDAPFTAALTRWSGRLDRAAVCAEGWVDRAVLAERLGAWRRDPTRGGWSLWMVLAVETWLDGVLRAQPGSLTS